MNREGFEKWYSQAYSWALKRDDNGEYNNQNTWDAFEGWQAAINSLEVTPELVMLARSRLHALAGESISGGTMRILLEDLFDAIKEHSNG
jgi:hypothetical protein